MSAAVATARRMLEQTGEHPVVSLFFDLNPDEFATAPARATQLTSLLDEAHRAARSDDSLGHDDRKVLLEDLGRVESYLQSDEAPISGARTLAVFCSGRDDLFEAVPMAHPFAPRVVIARRPYVEPLVAGEEDERWCITLVNRRAGRIFEGDAQELALDASVDDEVRNRHHKGGLSQANYQRSVDDEAEHHLRHVAEELYRHWQSRRFSRLVLGGPEQDVDEFAGRLSNDLRPLLTTGRLSLDPETATVPEVKAAVLDLLEHEQVAARRGVIAALEERTATGTAVLGIEATLTALGERRVETLVLALNFAARGGRCPTCGLLYPEGTASCPADGTALEPVADLREAAVEAAVLQDAGVAVVGEGNDLAPPPLTRGGGIGALLRF